LTSTDATGHFAIPEVLAPYDVAIVPDPGEEAHVYLGMSDLTPTIHLATIAASSAPLINQATVEATTSPCTETVWVSAGVELTTDKLAWKSVGIPYGHPDGSMTWQVQWRGTPTVTARIDAFQYQFDATTFSPTHYVGYDTGEVSLTNGVTAPWSASWKTPPFSEKPVPVTLSGAGSDASLSSVLMMSTGGQWPGETLMSQTTTGPIVSFLVPDVPGASFTIGAEIDDSSGQTGCIVPSLTAGATGPVVHLDPKPTLTSPAAGDIFGAGSPLQWTLGAEGTASLTFRSAGPGPGPTIYLYGGDGSSMMPDLSGMGVDLPHGAAYVAVLERVGAAATVDDIAANGPSSFRPDDQPSTFGATPPITVTTP
jgi:hypothetical protein